MNRGVERLRAAVEHGHVEGQLLDAAADHLEQRLRDLVDRSRVVQEHGDPFPLRRLRIDSMNGASTRAASWRPVTPSS